MKLITEKLSSLQSGIYDLQRYLKIDRFNVDEEYIYKYINLGGLKGMITNHEVWASNSMFMNDSEEFTHGIKNFKFLIAEMEKNNKKVECFKEMIHNKDSSKSYISCFSTEKDMLSQWRAYGSFNVEFEVSKLKEMFCKLQLKKISYIPEFKKLIDSERSKYSEDIKLFESLITLYEETFKLEENYSKISKNQLGDDPKNNVSNQDKLYMQSLQTTLDEILISFKHVGFEEEKEVRLFYLDNEEWLKDNKIQKQKIEIREGKTLFIPYIKIKADDRLPITSIYVSPALKNEFPRVQEGLKQFLTNSDYHDVDIVPSEIPYRPN